MKHYVIIDEWATECDDGVKILGVEHTWEDAMKVWNFHVDKFREYVTRLGWRIDKDEDGCFRAEQEGAYVPAHNFIYILEV